MNKELLQKKIHKLFELARLHSWCREIYNEIDEIERLNYPTKFSVINEIVNGKLQSKDTPREELILSSALLFKLTGQPGEITNLLFNKLRDKLFVKDYYFLMKQLFQDKYPVPSELTYDITERAFIDTKTAIKRALEIDKIMSTEGGVKTVLYFTLLLCMPKLNAENKAMLLILLSRIDADKPANLETVIIDFFKKIQITEGDLEEIIESVNQEKEKKNIIIPQKKTEPHFNQTPNKLSITEILSNVREVQKQTSTQNPTLQPDETIINKKINGAKKIKRKPKSKSEADRFEPLKELINSETIDNKAEKPSLFNKKHESRNENTVNRTSNKKKPPKKIKNEIEDLQNKTSSAKEPVGYTKTRNTSDVKTASKQFFEILFGPLSGTLKDLIDGILSGKIFRKKDIQAQKSNKKIRSAETNSTGGIKSKVNKRILQLFNKSRKITLPLPKKIKYSILAIVAGGLAFLLITRIDISKDHLSDITENKAGHEELISQRLKTPVSDEKNSPSKMVKKDPPFNLEKSGNHIIWKIQKNENVWRFYLYLQNNTLPFAAIIYENENWSQFLKKLQGLNPEIEDLDYIYPGETIKVY